ncbi:MAG: ComF family protein [Bacteroidia bacterium]
MLKDLLSLLFSEGCYTCGKSLTQQETCVCFDCLEQFIETGFEKTPQKNDLFFRFAGKVPIDGTISAYYFDKQGFLQKLLHELKYKDRPEIGVFLGKLLALKLQKHDFLTGIEVLVPVPLHPQKERQRGYNQAAEICKGVSEVTGLAIDLEYLRRNKYTETQTRKSLQERWENVADAFEVRDTAYQGVLLIDDVITTGATLESCIKALITKDLAPKTIKIASVALARGRD